MERRSNFQGPLSESVGQQLEKEATSFIEFAANASGFSSIRERSVKGRKTAFESLSD
jgi:hypothetical protein